MATMLSRALAGVVLVGGLAAIVWVTTSNEDSSNSVAASTQSDEAQTAAPDTPLDEIPFLGEADTLTGLDGWLNTDANSLEEIRAANKVTVVQFWTFSCSNCKNTIPALQNLYADYGDRGLEIVGVHAPEFSFEAEVDNIVDAAANLGVTWPIALDTEKRNFHRWQEGPTGYWPRVYLIDEDGQIRLNSRGDRDSVYAELHEFVGRLLEEA